MPKTDNKKKPSKSKLKKSTKKSDSSFLQKIGSRLEAWQLSHRLLAWFLLIIFVWFIAGYGLAQWYIWNNRHKPVEIGITFVPNYARYFELDPQEVFRAFIDDLGVRRFRLVSYWREGEPNRDDYHFEELDWQFRMAEEAGAKVSLAIGLRQPRWPECHMPGWAESMPTSEWRVHLKEYMQVVIERYKNSPALESYQLENEFFMTVFGICPDHSRERLIDEYHFVKSIDSTHPVVISRSNNWIGLPLNEPRPDEFAISVYKRVWDKTFTKRYFEYPLPAWFYAMLAGGGKIFTGKDMFVHELQAEPWLPEGYNMLTAPTEEYYKSLNPERLHDRIEYGTATGMKKIDLWGAEWWYYMKEKRGTPEIWNTAKESIQNANN